MNREKDLKKKDVTAVNKMILILASGVLLLGHLEPTTCLEIEREGDNELNDTTKLTMRSESTEHNYSHT
jgi:hypothetical protein